MVRGIVMIALATAFGYAPVQCGSSNGSDYEMEETPGEALYRLAEEFKAAGDRAAWHSTLKHLIARYPSSRFATTARQDLVDAGVDPNENVAGDGAPSDAVTAK